MIIPDSSHAPIPVQNATALTVSIAHRARLLGRETFLQTMEGPGVFRDTSFSEFAELVAVFRSWMQVHSVQGDLLAVAAIRSADTVAVITAGLLESRVVVPINPRLKAPQIAGILERSGATALVADGAVLHALAGGGMLDDAARERPTLLINRQRLQPFQRAAYEPVLGVLDQKHMPEATGATSEAGQRRPEGICLFTSGSTGEPKGVLIAQDDVYARALAEVALFNLTADDVLLSLLPFSFDVGFNQMMTALVTGCRLVIADSWTPKDITQLIELFAVTGVSCVPSIWRDFLGSGARLDREGAHRALRYVTVSGGDLAPDELLRLQDVLGVGLFKTYGQTEGFRLTCLLPHELAARPTSVGRPFGSARVSVVRDDFTLADPMEEGEILLAGLGVMQGYLGDVDTSAKRVPNPFRQSDADPEYAIRTGDFGHLDAEGYLFLRGRRDLMVKINGNRVYPEEVRRLLVGVAGVRDAAVVGVPRTGADAVLTAFLVVGENEELPVIQRRLRQSLPPFMIPAVVLLREAIPMTAGGKQDMGALRLEAEAAVSPHSPSSNTNT